MTGTRCNSTYNSGRLTPVCFMSGLRSVAVFDVVVSRPRDCLSVSGLVLHKTKQVHPVRQEAGGRQPCASGSTHCVSRPKRACPGSFCRQNHRKGHRAPSVSTRTGEPWMMPETDGDRAMSNGKGIKNVAEALVQGHVHWSISTRFRRCIHWRLTLYVVNDCDSGKQQ